MLSEHHITLTPWQNVVYSLVVGYSFDIDNGFEILSDAK